MLLQSEAEAFGDRVSEPYGVRVEDGSNLTPCHPNRQQLNLDVYAADWNNDGGSDLWIQFPDYPNDGLIYLFDFVPLRIKQVDNGLSISGGAQAATAVTYDRLNSGNNYQRTAAAMAATAYADQDVSGPIYVVKQVDSFDGVGGTYTTTYKYQDLISNLRGRGVIGFQQMTVTDQKTHIVQTTNYRTDFPYFGLVDWQTKVCHGCLNGSDVTISQTQNSYKEKVFDGVIGGTAFHQVHLTLTTAYNWDLDGTQLPSTTTNFRPDSCANTTTCFDDYGNPLDVIVTTTTPDGYYAKKETVSQFDNTDDADNWLIGRLRNSTVTADYKEKLNNKDVPLVRTSSFTYAPGGVGILNDETIEPDNGSNQDCNGNTGNYTGCALDTAYTLDAWGHHATAKMTGAGLLGANMRETDYSYSASGGYNGQFLTQVTKYVNGTDTEVDNWTYRTDFGVPLSHTNRNNQTTQWTYDGFGRVTQETRPDNSTTNYNYHYCSGDAEIHGDDTTCPANATFSVWTTTLGVDGKNIAPPTRTYYDALSREIASDIFAFDGQHWSRIDTIYGGNGNVYQKSRPYFVGSAGVYVTYHHDFLGRLTEIDEPQSDGHITNTYYDYDGLTTVATDDNGRQTTTVKNALGQNYTVTNAKSQTTYYGYDSFGELVETKDPNGNIATNTYDRRGHRYASTDPDMGSWSYQYNAAGDIMVQQNATQTTPTTMSYDRLGRLVARSEPDMSSAWTYGTASNQSTYPYSIGMLVQSTCTSGTTCPQLSNGGYSRTHSYDSLGRPVGVKIDIGTHSFFTQVTYDGDGRKNTTRYFSGYTIQNVYDDATTNAGYLYQVIDPSANSFFLWQADARDAEGHLTQFETGNGLVREADGYDAYNGKILDVCASANTMPTNCNANLVNLSYTWGHIGNLATRADAFANNAPVESFCYDELYRVTDYSFGGSDCHYAANNTHIDFDALANIADKSDTSCNTVGCYQYGPNANAPGPHEVSSITPCSGCNVDGVSSGSTANFFYDANGNMQCVTSHSSCDAYAARTMTWTSFNKPASVAQGAITDTFYYDPEHNRVEMDYTSPSATTTYYLNDPTANVMSERVVTSSTMYRNYVMVDGKIAAMRITQLGISNLPTLYYPVEDHLGSIAGFVDGNPTTQTGQPNSSFGTVVYRFSYDAWGMPRDPNTWVDNCQDSPQSPFGRGFISQEHLPNGICLINLNARMYDPRIARFLSADSLVQDIDDLQSLNRYSYAMNDPLLYSDPSGNCSGVFGCFFAWETFGPGMFFIGPTLRNNPWVGDLTVVAAGSACGPAGPICAAIAAAGVTGEEGGHTGAVLRNFAVTLGEAEGMQIVGGYVDNLEGTGQVGLVEGEALRVTLHSFVGGLASVAGGGKFGSGFLAAGFGALTDSGSDAQFNALDLVLHAAAGGVGSELGGGKFANGAVTGAFGYLFNFLNSETLREVSACEHMNLAACDAAVAMEQKSGDNKIPDIGTTLRQFAEWTIGFGGGGAAATIAAPAASEAAAAVREFGNTGRIITEFWRGVLSPTMDAVTREEPLIELPHEEVVLPELPSTTTTEVAPPPPLPKPIWDEPKF